MFYWQKVKLNVGFDYILYYRDIEARTLEYYCPSRQVWVLSLKKDTKDLEEIKMFN